MAIILIMPKNYLSPELMGIYLIICLKTSTSYSPQEMPDSGKIDRTFGKISP